nr:MAG TPA: hypothetical protein [Caudoviricetes sp.]
MRFNTVSLNYYHRKDSVSAPYRQVFEVKLYK